uniref:Uncharacterized protein n=1 Tax=Thermobifida fusca TaxID=2021 RepID=Q9XCD3_THEFU|nr:unknown [Thermobifida fusca YX]
MPLEPRLDIGADRTHPQPAGPHIIQRLPHQPAAHPLPLERAVHPSVEEDHPITGNRLVFRETGDFLPGTDLVPVLCRIVDHRDIHGVPLPFPRRRRISHPAACPGLSSSPGQPEHAPARRTPATALAW